VLKVKYNNIIPLLKYFPPYDSNKYILIKYMIYHDINNKFYAWIYHNRYNCLFPSKMSQYSENRKIQHFDIMYVMFENIFMTFMKIH